MAETKFGMAALFETVPDIYRAAEKVRDAGFQHWDVHTPFPVHGLDAAMGLKRSRVPVLTFIGGVTGCLTGVFIAWYMGKYDYPLIVGGKPFFSLIFPFPIYYELTILLAAFGTFLGMFLTNFLPRHHHPVMNFERWAEVMDDKFLIVIESRDPRYETEKTRRFLEGLGGVDVSEVAD